MATEVETTGERYMALVRAFPLRPIKSEAELDRAIAVIDGLIDQGASNRIPEEDDYMFVLGTLIEQYEDVHHQMGMDGEGE